MTKARSNKAGRSQYEFAPKILGVDVSYFGDDQSVIFLRQGISSKVLWRGREVDTVDLAGYVGEFIIRENIDATFVDAGGPGAGVIDQLKRLGHEPISIYFGGKSYKKQYLNKRAEMWGDMRDWLKGGADIPDENELGEELGGIEYHMTLKGQIQLEKKELMKKRGLSSPDSADALALTFAQPVYKYNPLERGRKEEQTMAKTSYKVLG